MFVLMRKRLSFNLDKNKKEKGERREEKYKYIIYMHIYRYVNMYVCMTIMFRVYGKEATLLVSYYYLVLHSRNCFRVHCFTIKPAVQEDNSNP